MNESGCIVTVEMKFRFQTDFLDRIFISQGIIQEGETRMDAILRVNKEIEETAARLRKEAGVSIVSQWGADYNPPQSTLTTSGNGTMVIDLQVEKLEIAIDNATTLEELAPIKEAIWKAGLSTQYMNKVKELSKL
jgi:hypothetical protein